LLAEGNHVDDQHGAEALHDLENMQRQYEASRDPMVLWVAYLHCREDKLAIPEWILSAFDQISYRLAYSWARRDPVFGNAASARLGVAVPPDDRHWRTTIADVFGFSPSTAGGPTDPFDRAARFQLEAEVAAAVRDLIDDGQNESSAYYLVSTNMGMSESAVRRAWHRWRDAVRHAVQPSSQD
jgi:hypothetical protein